MFDHWALIKGLPYEDQKAGDIVLAIRKRKGLKEELPKLDDYQDRMWFKCHLTLLINLGIYIENKMFYNIKNNKSNGCWNINIVWLADIWEENQNVRINHNQFTWRQSVNLFTKRGYSLKDSQIKAVPT